MHGLKPYLSGKGLSRQLTEAHYGVSVKGVQTNFMGGRRDLSRQNSYNGILMTW